jgi:MFS family permease
MNRPIQAVTYRALLRHPGVLRVFTAAALGRLSYATLSLSLLLTVEHATRSYAVAGTALGASSLASVTMPLKSRLIDRAGPRRVLPLLGVAFAAVCTGTAVAATAGLSEPLLYVGLSAAAGLTAGPVHAGAMGSAGTGAGGPPTRLQPRRRGRGNLVRGRTCSGRCRPVHQQQRYRPYPHGRAERAGCGRHRHVICGKTS